MAVPKEEEEPLEGGIVLKEAVLQDTTSELKRRLETVQHFNAFAQDIIVLPPSPVRTYSRLSQTPMFRRIVSKSDPMERFRIKSEELLRSVPPSWNTQPPEDGPFTDVSLPVQKSKLRLEQRGPIGSSSSVPQSIIRPSTARPFAPFARSPHPPSDRPLVDKAFAFPSKGNFGQKSRRPFTARAAAENFEASGRLHLQQKAMPQTTRTREETHTPRRPTSTYSARVRTTIPVSAAFVHPNRTPRRPPQLLLNRPQRITAPNFMNIPDRSINSIDSSLRRAWGSAAGLDPEKSGGGDGEDQIMSRRQTMERIQDLTHRALACRRAGRKRAEANMHFAMGVLYDNSGLHLKAAKCYTSFSQVLDTEQDNFAHALAHNSIGVSCMLLGKGYGTRALFHHQRHAEQTTDPAGSFVAHSNLGLVHMYMGSGEEATKEHQKALEIAILQGDERMQEVATGNLGRCSFVNRDYASAKAGLLQELNLARGMHDVRAQASVLEKLGEIANAEKDFDSASSYFNQERELAKRKGMQITSSNARVKLGISLGNSGLEERMREVERSMSTTF